MNLEEYKDFYNFITADIIPGHLSPELLKRFKSNSKMYFTQDNLLYKNNKSNPEQPLLVIKMPDMEKILFNGYSDIHAGHFGIENTFYKISQKYYWPGIYKSIKNYIKTCNIY